MGIFTEFVENRINVGSATDWQDAIRKTAQPLLDDNCIKESYIDDMIGVVNEFGGYIVLMPGFCMPHAKNNDNVMKTSMSVYALKDSNIIFPDTEEDEPVEIIFCLAAFDTTSHQDLLVQVAEILQDDDLLAKLYKTKDVAELTTMVNSL